MINLLLDYLGKGGGVMVFLLLVCFVFLHIGAGKFFLFRRYRQIRNLALGKGSKINLKGNVQVEMKTEWFVKEYPGASTFRLEAPGIMTEEFIQEAMCFHVARLEAGLNTMAAWISVAPLLGLLGTVIGMIATFKMITLFGVGDPSVMSEGISVALLTTQAGLMVAFPGLLFLNHLQSRKNALVNDILTDGDSLMKRNRKSQTHFQTAPQAR
jgi:biopolymer transport protein ExbB/TolQ